MKDVPALLQTVMAATGNTLARCWQIVTRRGDVFGFTKHTRNLVVEGITYQSLWGIREAAIETGEGFAVGNQDLSLFLSKLDEQDIDGGRYDQARISAFDVDVQQPDAGIIPHKVGFLGNITRADGVATLEIRGPTQMLQTKIGELYTTGCPVKLGSPRCGVELHDTGFTYTWTVTVATDTLEAPQTLLDVQGFRAGQVIEVLGTATNDGIYVLATVSGDTMTITGTFPGTDETLLATVVRRNGFVYQAVVDSVNVLSPRRIFTVEPLLDAQGNPPAANIFQEGNVVWVTGANVGAIAKDIRSHVGLTMTLYDELAFDIVSGDTCILEVGCNKLVQTCIGTFDNFINYQGFPYVPTPEQIFDSPVSG